MRPLALRAGARVHRGARPPGSTPSAAPRPVRAGRRSPTTPCRSTWARRWPASGCPASTSTRSRRARSASSSAAVDELWPRHALVTPRAWSWSARARAASRWPSRSRRGCVAGRGARVEVLLLENGPRVLPGYAASAAARVQRRGRGARDRDPHGARVTRVEGGRGASGSGDRLARRRGGLGGGRRRAAALRRAPGSRPTRAASCGSSDAPVRGPRRGLRGGRLRGVVGGSRPGQGRRLRGPPGAGTRA